MTFIQYIFIALAIISAVGFYEIYKIDKHFKNKK